MIDAKDIEIINSYLPKTQDRFVVSAIINYIGYYIQGVKVESTYLNSVFKVKLVGGFLWLEFTYLQDTLCIYLVHKPIPNQPYEVFASFRPSQGKNFHIWFESEVMPLVQQEIMDRIKSDTNS